MKNLNHIHQIIGGDLPQTQFPICYLQKFSNHKDLITVFSVINANGLFSNLSQYGISQGGSILFTNSGEISSANPQKQL